VVETGLAELVPMMALLCSHLGLTRRMGSEALERPEAAGWWRSLVASVVELGVSGVTLHVFWPRWSWRALTLCVGLAQVGNGRSVHGLGA
jgi:hypothetical protein